MAKTLNDFARERLVELDAEAKTLGARLEIVNAERAQIHRLLGKPAKAAPAADPAAAEKPAPGRRRASGSLLPPGLDPAHEAVIGKVIGV